MPAELLERRNGEFAPPVEAETTSDRRVFMPATDIFESEGELVVLADMPGVEKDNVEIMLEQNVLTIYGRVTEPELCGYRLVHCEFGTGNFRRVFALSSEIDRDKIEASLKNGVLKLVLPKSKSALPRKIVLQ
jgi:HSP20 family molecular chaperone IbpA